MAASAVRGKPWGGGRLDPVDPLWWGLPIATGGAVLYNQELGTIQETAGRRALLAERGRSGCALWGPYKVLQPGRYAVEYGIGKGAGSAAKGDPIVAVIDVARDGGNEVVAKREIRLSELTEEETRFHLMFELEAASTCEFRIFAEGGVPLVLQEARPLVEVATRAIDPAALFDSRRFPDPATAGAPFLAAEEAQFRALYDRGVGVRVVGHDVVLTVGGVSLYCRCRDDMNFIGEIFFENAYTIATGHDTCVIDVGMNIGLASLLFASRPQVKEVHSFEPFPTTFARASANLGLNPALAAKITPYHIGLSDRDEEATFIVPDTGDSGGMAARQHRHGKPFPLVLRDAASVLRPIVEQARDKGRDVILKVDCEGGEFDIFRSLAEAGLFDRISAVLCEWHAVFDGQNQAQLTDPLTRAGFIIFDQSPPTGNGFFYAARLAR